MAGEFGHHGPSAECRRRAAIWSNVANGRFPPFALRWQRRRVARWWMQVVSTCGSSARLTSRLFRHRADPRVHRGSIRSFDAFLFRPLLRKAAALTQKVPCLQRSLALQPNDTEAKPRVEQPLLILITARKLVPGMICPPERLWSLTA